MWYPLEFLIFVALFSSSAVALWIVLLSSETLLDLLLEALRPFY